MEKLITKKDLFGVFLRGFFYQFSWNYERMQALGYCWVILPVLEKIYANQPDKLQESVERNLEFFNTQPNMAMPIMGVSLSMEEMIARGEDIDGSAISSVKVSMMGPLAGIGDSFFWFTAFPIIAGIGVSLSTGGSLLGPLVFLIIWNVINIGTRYLGLFYGYKLGTNFVARMAEMNLMQRLSEGATIVGLMVVGVMTATMIDVPFSLVIGEGEQAMTLASIFDSIMPNIVPLLLTLGIFRLIKKGRSSVTILIAVILVSILGAVVGIF